MNWKSYEWQIFALASAFFAALTAILGKIGVAGINSNLATFIRTIVILAVTAGILSLRHEWTTPEAISQKTYLFLGLSGIATGFSWLCYYRALQIGPASGVVPVDKLSVVFVLIFSVVFLGEAMTTKVLVGGGLVTIGAIILAL